MPTPSEVLEGEVERINEQLETAVGVHLNCLEALSAAATVVEELRGQLVRAESALNAWNGVAPTPAQEVSVDKPKKPKDRKPASDNPYATIQCKGCGKTGSVRETLKQTDSGKTYRAMNCGSCGHVQL